jgi:hypothetical protein
MEKEKREQEEMQRQQDEENGADDMTDIQIV